MDVEAIISPCLHVHLRARLRPEARLWEDLGVDGIMLLAIAVDLEDASGVQVPDAEVDTWVTVADVSASMQRLCSDPVEALGGG